jgi:murein DD-endopeptidase MepM/ murein hydrolase activator NlpD
MEEHYQSEMDIADQHNKYYGKKYQIKGKVMPPRRSTQGSAANSAAGPVGLVKVKEDFPVYPEPSDFEDGDPQADQVMNQVHDLYPWRAFKQNAPIQASAQGGNTIAFGSEVHLAPIGSGMESYRTNLSGYRVDAGTGPNMQAYGAAQQTGGQVVPMARLNFGNATAVASKPKQGKSYLSQGTLTSDTQIPGAGMPANTRVTSPFGMRFHPIKKKNKMHSGIDYAGGKRSAARSAGISAKMVATKPEHIEPCMSPFDGKVKSISIKVGSKTGYGGLIKIEHTVKDKGGNERQIETRYGLVEHTNLKVGDEVKKGDIVAHIGSQGGSTGPHLHFEVREKRKALNPVDLFGWQFGPPAPPPPQGQEEDDLPEEDLGEEGN